MNVMQLPASDLTYGTMPGSPRSDRNTFFWSLPVFGRKMLRKSQSARGPLGFEFGRKMLRKSQSARGPAPKAPRNVNPARAITWLVA